MQSLDAIGAVPLLLPGYKHRCASAQEEAERIVSEARKAAQAVIAEAKESTQAEQNKKLAEVKAVSTYLSPGRISGFVIGVQPAAGYH